MKSEKEGLLNYKIAKNHKDEIAKIFSELTFDYICFLNIPTSQDDPSASTGQIQSRFLANPGTATCYNNRFAIQSILASTHTRINHKINL